MARPGRARRYLADHAAPNGASLIATDGADVMGYLAIVWRSNQPGFRGEAAVVGSSQRVVTGAADHPAGFLGPGR